MVKNVDGPRPRYPSDEKRRERGQYVKVFHRVVTSDRTRDVWRDPERRGMLVELWRIADVQGAAHRGGWVTLGGVELQAITGRVHRSFAVRLVLNLAESVAYSTQIAGESVLVRVDNFAEIQDITPRLRGGTPPSPSPSPSTTKKEETAKGNTHSESAVADPGASAEASPEEGEKDDPAEADDDLALFPSVTAEEIAEAWQLVCVPRGAPAIRELTLERRRKLRLRIREHPAFAWWNEVFQRLARSSFAFGQGPRGWRVTFDWLIENAGNALKVLEGNYDGALPRRGLLHTS